MTAKELERRNSIVEVLEDDLNSLEEKIKLNNKPVVVGVGVSFKRDGTEEADGTKNLSNKDLMSAQTVMLKQQGEVEKIILGSTQNIISISRNMTDELDIHDKLLTDVNQNIDHTQVRMDKTNYRMKELLYKSSDCCLITVILILIAIVILIIFFL